jgi:hypothetical protein
MEGSLMTAEQTLLNLKMQANFGCGPGTSIQLYLDDWAWANQTLATEHDPDTDTASPVEILRGLGGCLTHSSAGFKNNYYLY